MKKSKSQKPKRKKKYNKPKGNRSDKKNVNRIQDMLKMINIVKGKVEKGKSETKDGRVGVCLQDV